MQTVDNAALVNQTIGGQFPKAVVLSCIDSRVPVETVLDQAIGDIFVARVAGNFENIDILGSLEYSCKVAGSKLVLVLGHESCGAVKAACDGVELGNITDMLANILPAVKQSSDEVEGELNSANKAFVAKTVENNVKLTIERIRERSSILKQMEDDGDIQIVGGVYMLSTGKVEMV
jgi:carbonic anhydrase